MFFLVNIDARRTLCVQDRDARIRHQKKVKYFEILQRLFFGHVDVQFPRCIMNTRSKGGRKTVVGGSGARQTNGGRALHGQRTMVRRGSFDGPVFA